MRVLTLAIIGFVVFVAAVKFYAPGEALQAAGTVPAVVGESEEDKALYSLGAAVAQNLTSFNLSSTELAKVQTGFADAALGRELQVDIETYLPQLRELQTSRIAAAAQATLTEEAAAAGAQRLESGLIIRHLQEGDGAHPTAADRVKVHYHGTLGNGKVFDSSVQRGEPATFPLGGVIPCWTEGVQLIKVGGKSRLTCPAELAYGERGAPPDIAPGATLIFEVELLGIETNAAPQE